MKRAFDIVVTRGEGMGKRLSIDAVVRVIGRGTNVDLPLLDQRVSRRHLEVHALASGVRIRVCPGAGPFLVHGNAYETWDGVPGDEVVIANTVLAIVERPAPTAGHDGTQATDVRHLVTGIAGDVHGLTAIFELIECLEGVRDRGALEAKVADWAHAHARATTTRIALADDLEIDAVLAARFPLVDELVVEATATGSFVTAPAYASPPGMIAFEFPFAPDALGLQTRRLLAVVGRVCALSLARARDTASSADDHESLRRLAVGSSREFSGESDAAKRLAAVIPRLAKSDASILLVGETGAGKTFAARLIHESGPRAHEPLRVLNCAAIPESLVESELFGHERGAFTGALAARVGAFEAAGSGTLLLDEIGELPLPSQAKLLRVLEEKRFERIGSNREIPLRARVIAATNRDLVAMVDEGRFRRDLYFRISVVSVTVPPLRERGDDLVELARGMLRDLASSAGRRLTGFSSGALDVIRKYTWPGNVRELRNAIERAIVLGETPTIEAHDLPDAVVSDASKAAAVVIAVSNDGLTVRLPANLEWLEGKAIEAALHATNGNRTRAAALLGIHRMTLFKKLREEPK